MEWASLSWADVKNETRQHSLMFLFWTNPRNERIPRERAWWRRVGRRFGRRHRRRSQKNQLHQTAGISRQDAHEVGSVGATGAARDDDSDEDGDAGGEGGSLDTDADAASRIAITENGGIGKRELEGQYRV